MINEKLLKLFWLSTYLNLYVLYTVIFNLKNAIYNSRYELSESCKELQDAGLIKIIVTIFKKED